KCAFRISSHCFVHQCGQHLEKMGAHFKKFVGWWATTKLIVIENVRHLFKPRQVTLHCQGKVISERRNYVLNQLLNQCRWFRGAESLRLRKKISIKRWLSSLCVLHKFSASRRTGSQDNDRTIIKANSINGHRDAASRPPHSSSAACQRTG